MAITLPDLRTEVGATSSDDAALQRILDAAKARLDQYVQSYSDAWVDATNTGVPDAVFDEAWLAVAVDAWNRHQAPNGYLTQQFDLPDGSTSSAPVRVSTDPLRAARPLLAPWCTEVAFS